MPIKRGPQYSEEFPHVINIKQLHFKTAVQIASACIRKGLSQLTQLLRTHCQRNETIHMHILLRPASGHLFDKVKVGEHVRFLTLTAQNWCTRLKAHHPSAGLSGSHNGLML